MQYEYRLYLCFYNIIFTEADLREKASLATNQEGPIPSPPLRLT